jgi:hypothetical protein
MTTPAPDDDALVDLVTRTLATVHAAFDRSSRDVDRASEEHLATWRDPEGSFRTVSVGIESGTGPREIMHVPLIDLLAPASMRLQQVRMTIPLPVSEPGEAGHEAGLARAATVVVTADDDGILTDVIEVIDPRAD